MSGRRRSRDSLKRKNRSKKAISQLSRIIDSPANFSLEIRDIAVRDTLMTIKEAWAEV